MGYQHVEFPSKSLQDTATYKMTAGKSPISVLQEMAQAKRILPPVYDVQPQGKEFYVTIRLGKNKEIFAKAVANTKQLAKQWCAKNALDRLNRGNVSFVHDPIENLISKSWGSLSLSNSLSQNYVGQLNELCSKRMVAVPQYSECGFQNGEFIIECKMFDNTVTQGHSIIKKDAKQKAAEAMLKVYSENERTRCRNRTELREVSCMNNEKTYKSSPLNENYVGILNEICSKIRVVPSYVEFATKNGEFIIECKIFDNTITRGQSKNKKDAKQKAAEAMLNKFGELGNEKPTKSFASSDEIVNLYKSIKSTMSFENHVGKLIEICIKNILPLPVYTERITENGEFAVDCKVIYKSVSKVTRGHSRSKQGAKERAAKEMIEILTECVHQEFQTLMKSVSIVETRQQNSTDKFTKNIDIEQSDSMPVEYMNREQLIMELRNLNVNHKITQVAGIKNVLVLKTEQTKNYKSFTFIETGKDSDKMYLDLLRKAVFGLRILKTDLEAVLQ